MKILKLIYVSSILSLFFSTKAESTIVGIFVTNNSVFYPNNVSVEVGDTIKWITLPMEIQHTTVCDGRPGTIRPPGAAPWSSPVLNLNGFYYVIQVEGFYQYKCGLEGHTGIINASLITSTTINHEVINNYSLNQNYPNPFNPTTTISFSISKSTFVELKVYDLNGKELRTLINKFKPQGSYGIKFDGQNIPSGVYYYKLDTEDFTEIKKMVLIK